MALLRRLSLQESVADFIARINPLRPGGTDELTPDRIWELNRARTQNENATGLFRERFLKQLEKFEVGFDTPDPLADIVPIADRRDEVWGQINQQPAFEQLWLSYETLWNAPPFRKGPGAHQMGLYRKPLSEVMIHLDSEAPSELLAAFFPKVPEWQVKARANLDAALEKRCLNGEQPPAMAGPVVRNNNHNVRRGGAQQIQQIPYVAMPYNFDDNTKESRAIGTGAETKYRASWTMWSTASRSSVVRVAPIDPQQTCPRGTQTECVDGSGAWRFGFRPNEPSPIRAREWATANPFRIRDLTAQHFSVKTGIQMIGQDFQGGTKGKDVLEWNNILAMLRSYYIRDVDKAIGKPDDSLIILGELLTVTSFDGDGFQVRDLRPLKPRIANGKWYFPATSIPYYGQQIADGFVRNKGTVNTDLLRAAVSAEFWTDFEPRLAKQFNVRKQSPYDASERFELFWGRHYAIRLGIVKAKLLLRYGLQWMMPNPQNMVIEMESNWKPSGSMVLRDVGDWDIHCEAAHAIWGATAVAPAGMPGERPVMDWQTIQNDFLKIEYNPMAQAYYYKGGEHHPIPNDTYTHYPNKSLKTQLGWAGYSTFKVWGGAQRWDDVPDCPITDAMMIRWGALHNEAYLKYLQETARVDLGSARQKNREQLIANLAGAVPPGFDTWKGDETNTLASLLHTAITTPDSLQKIRAQHPVEQQRRSQAEEQRLKMEREEARLLKHMRGA